MLTNTRRVHLAELFVVRYMPCLVPQPAKPVGRLDDLVKASLGKSFVDLLLYENVDIDPAV